MIARLARGARRLLRDQTGVVAPMIATLGVSLLAAAGLALDVGLYQMDSRDLRAATEAAALAAAQSPAQAQARAQDYLTRNGFAPAVLQTVTVGRYCADSHLAANQRFDPSFTRCPGAGVANAVRIQTRQPSRRFLSRVLGEAVVVPAVTATATASRIDEAGVQISSGLLTVNNALVSAVNDLLGALIGIKLRLSTADVEALMAGNVHAGLFFDKLAQRAGQTGTYGELLQGSYGLQDIALSAADATSSASTAAALRLFGGQAGNGYKVPLKDLFALGVWKNMPVGEADDRPALRAGLNAYQLLSYAVQAGPTVVDLSGAVSALVPVSTVKIALVTSNAPDRPRFAFGPAGETQVFTAALRLQVLVDVPVNIPLIANVSVHLPIYLDVAAAKAEVTGIDCPGTAEQARDTTVAVRATTGEINAYIGDPTFNAMTKTLPELNAGMIQRTNIAHVDLLGGLVPVVDIKGRAVVQPVAGASSTALTFGPGVGGPDAPIAPKSVGNQVSLSQTLGGLTASLLSTNGLSIELLGACLPLVCSSTQSLVRDTVLPAIVAPVTQLVGTVVDPLLNNVLGALGVQLGHATVWVGGARCGVPVLV